MFFWGLPFWWSLSPASIESINLWAPGYPKTLERCNGKPSGLVERPWNETTGCFFLGLEEVALFLVEMKFPWKCWIVDVFFFKTCFLGSSDSTKMETTIRYYIPCMYIRILYVAAKPELICIIICIIRKNKCIQCLCMHNKDIRMCFSKLYSVF